MGAMDPPSRGGAPPPAAFPASALGPLLALALGACAEPPAPGPAPAAVGAAQAAAGGPGGGPRQAAAREGRERAPAAKGAGEPAVAIDGPGPINIANRGAYAVSGSCAGAPGAAVSVSVAGEAATAACGAGGRWRAVVAVAGRVEDGPVAVAAALGAASASATARKDTVAPRVGLGRAPPSVSMRNEAGYALSGACSEPGEAVRVSVGALSFAAGCGGGGWAGSWDVRSLRGARFDVVVAHADPAGNRSSKAYRRLARDVEPPAVRADPPALVDARNQRAYRLSGTCSERGRGVRVALAGAGRPWAARCSAAGAWALEVDASALAEGDFALSVSQRDFLGNRGAFAGSVRKRMSALAFDGGRPPDIDAGNRGAYRMSGTCARDGEVTVSVPGLAPVRAACAGGAWSSSPVDTHGAPVGTLAVSATLSVAGAVAGGVSATLASRAPLHMPYRLLTSNSYSRDHVTGVHRNRLGAVAAPPGAAFAYFALASVGLEGLPGGPYTAEELDRMREEWVTFFTLDLDTGELALTDKRATLESLFDLPSKRRDSYYLSDIVASRQRADLPMPAKFALGILVTHAGEQGAASSETVEVEVRAPAFGDPDCGISDWDADLGAWTAEEASAHRRAACVHLDYPIRPRGVRFATSQADTDRLPGALAQPRANYRIAFRDEFSGPDGSRLDHRLWAAPTGNDCSFGVRGGRLALTVSTTCLSAAGRMIKASLQSRFQYKYGYIEGRFHGLRTGDEGGGHFHWHSYPRGDHWAFNGRSNVPEERARDYVSFVCRGGDARRQRARWLDTLGVEMQYIETYRNEPDDHRYWWVYHSTHPFTAERDCDDDPVVYSGLHWANVYIAEADKEAAHTVGVEWTPSGHRGFVNGRRYTGYFFSQRPIFAHYGYSESDAKPPTIYRYEGTGKVVDGLVASTVSHVYQGFGMSWTPGSTKETDERPSGWSDTVEIDYIRVYQPVDRYASETRTYK